MADPHENKTIDKRVVHRYVRKGIVDEKEYDKHLKNLPDLAEQAAPVEASIEGEDLEDEADETEGAP
jgi:hypothetical protein